MSKSYSYPRTVINTIAKRHSVVVPRTEDTTSIFAFLITKKGPKNELHAVHSYAEFVDIYGELDSESFEKNGQAALNVINWLNNGGTVYFTRISDQAEYAEYQATITTQGASEGQEETTILKPFKAKYPGKYYKDTKLIVSKINDNTCRIIVSDNGVRKELFTVNENNISYVFQSSEYIEGTAELTFKNLLKVAEAALDLTVSSSKTWTSEDFNLAVEGFFKIENNTSVAQKLLSNRLIAPFDLVLDAGYPAEIKKELYDYFNTNRKDVICIFDIYELYGITTEKKYYSLTTPIALTVDSDDRKIKKSIGESAEVIIEPTLIENANANIIVYDQWFKVSDEILNNGKIINVAPSYFLSKLIPYNDLTYGIQYPIAGLRRGILQDALYVNNNPTDLEKEDLFTNRVNYVEKTSREYAFMNQRVFDDSTSENYTALSFSNNARTFAKIKKDIEILGREYLFEFNDAQTLANMSNILNRYIGEWVANRTLATGYVEVSKNQYSDEAVDVSISVRFTGTIEVITANIVIE